MNTKPKQDEIIEQLNSIKFDEEVIFSHLNLGFIGPIEGIETSTALSQFVYGWLVSKLRRDQLFITPSFSFSFSSKRPLHQNIYYMKDSNSKVGFFSNFLIKSKLAWRSYDPISSVLFIGNKKLIPKNFLLDCQLETYGDGSIWDFLYNTKSAQLVNINMDLASSYVHYLERRVDVPHRKNISLLGIAEGKEVSVRYYSRLNEFVHDDFEKVHATTICSGTRHHVGRGFVNSINLGKYSEIIEKNLMEDSNFYLKERLK